MISPGTKFFRRHFGAQFPVFHALIWSSNWSLADLQLINDPKSGGNFTNLQMLRMTKTVGSDSWIFDKFSDFLKVGNQLHWKISFSLASDLSQEISIPRQIFVWEIVLNLKIEVKMSEPKFERGMKAAQNFFREGWNRKSTELNRTLFINKSK